MLFFTFSAFFVKSFVIILIIFLPVTAWLSPSFYEMESERLIDLTNKLRTNLHIPRLIENDKLKRASQDKVNDMFINQYFDHISKSGKDLDYWLSSNHYNYTLAGENIAMGYKGADSIFNTWKRSKYHYDNLINPSFRHIGVAVSDGVYYGRNTIIAVQFFGSTGYQNEENELDLSNINHFEYKDLSNFTETGDLVAPFFVIPYKSNLINSGEISLNIIAPNADRVSIYVDDKLRKEEDLGIFKNFWTKIKLKDGKHTIKIKSSKGDDSIYSFGRVVNIDTTAPSKMSKGAILAVNKLSNNEYIVKAVVKLEPDVSSARVQFKDYSIPLVNNGSDWSGQKIIHNKDVFNILVNGHVVITDYAGNIAKNDIGLKNIVPIKTSFWDKYFFLKTSNYNKIKFIFKLADFYLLSLILFFLLFTLLSIKKHKKCTILFVFLFICVLSGLMFI